MGTVLWETLTGERLFDGKTDIEIFKKIRGCEVPPIGERRTDVPPALSAVLDIVLVADPANRYATADEFAHALSQVMKQAVGVNATDRARPGRRRGAREAPVRGHRSAVDDGALARHRVLEGRPGCRAAAADQPQGSDAGRDHAGAQAPADAATGPARQEEAVKLAGLALLAVAACSGDHAGMTGDDTPLPDAQADASPDAPPAAPIQWTLDKLAGELATATPGTDLAIAFVDLQTGETAQLDGDELHVSASSAKAWWVAAALDGAGLDVQRDAIGRVTRSYHPFFTAGPSTSFIAPQLTNVTMSAFDDEDRVIATVYPDGTTEAVAFDLASAPDGAPLFHATATDANGHLRETFTDLLDRIRVFIEHPSATTSSVTRYDYLATGELAQIVDAEGHSTTLGYDLRGLRVSLDNPDDGLIEDRFDLMGNHVALIEPNHRAIGAEVRYVYDRNRLARIDYPSKPDVTFTYGAPGAASFAAGRLVQVTDETGTQTHSYGALGEVRRTLRTVVDPLNPNATPKTFDLHLTSDSLGHLLRVGYPDGEVVTTAYDAAGMVSAVAGAGASWTKTYADQLRYDVFGNRTQIRFGNGALTTASFDPLRVRLAALATTLPDGTTRVQDLHYTYDPGGNPISIANTLPPPPNNGTRPGTSAAQFAYDGVDRLVHATGQAPLPSSKSTTYDLTFSYSASHNVLSKTLVHDVVSSGGNHSFPTDTNFAAAYTYAAARPHLPSRVGDLDLTYDPSGNPITRHKVGTSSEQQLVWDDDGRLVQIAGLGASQRNTYDAAGLRVFRHGQSGDTIFSSPYFDLEGSSHGTKHVFAGGTRVASVLRTTTLGADPPLPSQPGTAYFLHPDHLGSTGVVTSQSGDVNDAHEYFPDGEVWIDGSKSSNIDGYLFNGKQLDPETGFYDFGQRFYDPRASLWLGVDSAFTGDPSTAVRSPLHLASSAFSGHSPVRFRDADGRDWVRTSDVGGSASFRWVNNTVADIDREMRRVSCGEIPPGPEAADISAMDRRRIAHEPALESANWVIMVGVVGPVSGASGLLKLGVAYGVSQAKTEGDALFAAAFLGGGNLALGARAAAGDLAGDLTAAAARARATVGAGRGPVNGTRAHSAFRAEVEALGRTDLATEVSYLNGRVVPYGTRGSVRLDVVQGPLDAPTAVFDFKTGSASLSPGRIQQIQQHLPSSAQGIPVSEIR